MIEDVKNLKKLIVTTKRGRYFIENDPLILQIIENAKWIDSVKSNPSLEDIQKILDINNYQDIIYNEQRDILSCMIGVEGGHAIENDLQKLEKLYKCCGEAN